MRVHCAIVATSALSATVSSLYLYAVVYLRASCPTQISTQLISRRCPRTHAATGEGCVIWQWIFYPSLAVGNAKCWLRCAHAYFISRKPQFSVRHGHGQSHAGSGLGGASDLRVSLSSSDRTTGTQCGPAPQNTTGLKSRCALLVWGVGERPEATLRRPVLYNGSHGRARAYTSGWHLLHTAHVPFAPKGGSLMSSSLRSPASSRPQVCHKHWYLPAQTFFDGGSLPDS